MGHFSNNRSVNQTCFKGSKRLLLICIDGLSWNLLHKFCNENVLPNFTKIIKNGASGELESMYPLISPRIWATIFTGKIPEKHGVKDFYITSKSIRTKQIWEVLSENGYKVGVFQPLTAFKPEQSYSFFVPGNLSMENNACPADLEFLHEFSLKFRACANVKISPLSLVKYGYKLLKNGCRIKTLLKALWVYLQLLGSSNVSPLDRFYKLKEMETVLNSEVFIHCLKKYSPDFAVFYDNCIDFVSHFYWKYMEPELFDSVDDEIVKKYGEAIRKYYLLIDKIIGEIISSFGKNEYFMIVSDHGFIADSEYTGMKWASGFNLNILSLLRLLNLEDKVYGIRLEYKGGIFRPKNKDIGVEDIERIFRNIKYKDSQNQVFLVDRSSSFVMAKLNLQALDQNQRVVLGESSECSLKDFLNFVSKTSGRHYHKGVLMIKGPDICSGKIIKNASIYDIFPTILAIYKVPIPRDTDGKVLTDIFRSKIEIKYADKLPMPERESIVAEELSRDQENHIKQRLKELGYI